VTQIRSKQFQLPIPSFNQHRSSLLYIPDRHC
jgi:hypothetical protein